MRGSVCNRQSYFSLLKRALPYKYIFALKVIHQLPQTYQMMTVLMVGLGGTRWGGMQFERVFVFGEQEKVTEKQRGR